MYSISYNSALAFGSDGSIVQYNITLNNRMYSFAADGNPLGTFTYHTYNEEDFQQVNSQYDYYGGNANISYNSEYALCNQISPKRLRS